MYDPYEYREIELLIMEKVNTADIVSISYRQVPLDPHPLILYGLNYMFRQWQQRNPPWTLFFENKDGTKTGFARTKHEEDAVNVAFAFSNLLDKPVV